MGRLGWCALAVVYACSDSTPKQTHVGFDAAPKTSAEDSCEAFGRAAVAIFDAELGRNGKADRLTPRLSGVTQATYEFACVEHRLSKAVISCAVEAAKTTKRQKDLRACGVPDKTGVLSDSRPGDPSCRDLAVSVGPKLRDELVKQGASPSTADSKAIDDYYVQLLLDSCGNGWSPGQRRCVAFMGSRIGTGLVPVCDVDFGSPARPVPKELVKAIAGSRSPAEVLAELETLADEACACGVDTKCLGKVETKATGVWLSAATDEFGPAESERLKQISRNFAACKGTASSAVLAEFERLADTACKCQTPTCIAAAKAKRELLEKKAKSGAFFAGPAGILFHATQVEHLKQLDAKYKGCVSR